MMSKIAIVVLCLQRKCGCGTIVLLNALKETRFYGTRQGMDVMDWKHPGGIRGGNTPEQAF